MQENRQTRVCTCFFFDKQIYLLIPCFKYVTNMTENVTNMLHKVKSRKIVHFRQFSETAFLNSFTIFSKSSVFA